VTPVPVPALRTAVAVPALPPPSFALLPPTVNTPAGAGLANFHGAQLWQSGFEPVPYPARDIFTGGILQPGNVVEVVVVELIVDGFEAGLEIGKVHHPAGGLRRIACYRQAHVERVPVQPRAFVSGRHVGEAMGGLEVKFLVDLHG
jgi:hypothetical protein